MNKTGWIIFTTVVILLLGGLVAWTRVTNPPIDLSGIDNNSIVAASSQNGNIGDHTEGSDSNKILLIEYGDYQCPGCGSAYPNVKTIVDEYSEDITFVFRNFPLTTIHPNAKAAAAAAEAAGLQDKFWEMHDMLYSNQNDWNSLDTSKRTDIFAQYASSIGIDVDQFKSDLGSRDVTSKINFDLALGKSVDVSATPTFYLDGEKLDDTLAGGFTGGDLTDIRAKLDSIIAEQK